jgi:pimeloyl-ACP methyl ester carboxylesterase
MLVFSSFAIDSSDADNSVNTGGSSLPHSEGSYEIKYYDTMFIDRYNASLAVRVYYPVTSEKLPGIVFLEGNLGWLEAWWDVKGLDKSFYYWLGENLSTCGYIMMFFDFQGQGDSTMGKDLPPSYSQQSVERWPDFLPWLNDTQDAIDWLIIQSEFNESSPIYNKLDINRISIMGHSTGASIGIIQAAIDTRIKSCIAMAPYDEGYPQELYRPPYPSDYIELRAYPLYIMVGSADMLTPSPPHPPYINGRAIYELAMTPKQYSVFKGGGHDPKTWNGDLVRMYSSYWLNYFIHGDLEYEALIGISTAKVDTISLLGLNYAPKLLIENITLYLVVEKGDEFIINFTVVNHGFATITGARCKLAFVGDFVTLVDYSDTICIIGNLSGGVTSVYGAIRYINWTLYANQTGDYTLHVIAYATNVDNYTCVIELRIIEDIVINNYFKLDVYIIMGIIIPIILLIVAVYMKFCKKR